MCGERTRSMRRGSTTMSLRALAQPLLHPRREDRVPVGRVGADHHDDVGLGHRLEVLRTCRLAEGLLEPVARGRVADPGARVDVVVAERGADHLLDDVDLFVRAARRGDRADRTRAVPLPDLQHPAGDGADRLVPVDLAPRVGDLLADHRLAARGPDGSRSQRRSVPSHTSGPRWRRRPCGAPCGPARRRAVSALNEQPTPQ